jgi:hypothetical protein
LTGLKGRKKLVFAIIFDRLRDIMPRLTVPDSIYERLKAKAAARQQSLDAYLADLAAQTDMAPNDSARQLAALESSAAAMTAWATAHLPPGHVVDDGRERIYEGRGE